MPQVLTRETQKQLALNALDESRAEMSADLRWARHQLSPTNMVHNVVDRHPKALVVGALALGFLVPQLLFRRKAPPPAPTPVAVAPAAAATSKSRAVASFLGGALWKAVRAPLIGLATQKLLPLVMQYIHRPDHAEMDEEPQYEQS